MLYVLVSGARDWPESKATIISEYFANIASREKFILVEGECRGVDLMARAAAEKLDMAVVRMPALWQKYGKAAGPKRNREMIQYVLDQRAAGHSVAMVFFHENIATSAGTKDAVNAAKKKGLAPVDGLDWWRRRKQSSRADNKTSLPTLPIPTSELDALVDELADSML